MLQPDLAVRQKNCSVCLHRYRFAIRQTEKDEEGTYTLPLRGNCKNDADLPSERKVIDSCQRQKVQIIEAKDSIFWYNHLA